MPKRFPMPILACLLWGWAVAAPAAAPDLTTAQAVSRSITREQVFDGTIEAVNQSTVSAQTAGRIAEINFDVDDYVPKGAVLLRFRDTEQRARLDQANATLQEAQARFNEAQAEYNRIRQVFARQLVSRSAMDKAAADLKAARARLEAAQAGQAGAQEQFDHTVVKAPFNGIVVARHVEVGETANVGQPLMTGLSLDHLRAVVAVPQQYVDALRRNGKARVYLTDAPREEIPAGKLTVFPSADPVTHTFKVRVDLPAVPKGLYPGMLVKVAFATGEEERLLVPTSAVVHRSEVTGVYVVAADGRVSFRQVMAGRDRGDMTEILAGLDAGEQVATDPIRAGVVLKEQPAEAPQ